jgi:hypothetical protein
MESRRVAAGDAPTCFWYWSCGYNHAEGPVTRKLGEAIGSFAKTLLRWQQLPEFDRV